MAVVFILLGSSLSPSSAAEYQPQSSTRQTSNTSAKKKKSSARLKAKKKKKRRKISRRVRRVTRAFVASSDLKPMARQLLQDRTPAAYAGVQAYARRHAGTDEAALAWLAIGYAHLLEHDYAKAVPALKRAQPRAGELADYVDYFLAMAYGAQGDSADVVKALGKFESNYPDSLFAVDAAVIYANALVAQNQPQKAITVLQPHRQPVRSDVELALGRAYIAAGQTEPGAEILHRLYYAMPLAPEADAANSDLSRLPPASVPIPTFDERKMRANDLLMARHYDDAVREYQALLPAAPADQRPAIQLDLGIALHHDGKDQDAKNLLQSIPGASADVNAERVFELMEIARGDSDEDQIEKLAAELRQEAPNSVWFDRGLLLAGNACLLKRDYDKAIDFYRELDQRFPDSPRAHYAHWKATWLSLRQNRTDEARKQMEEQIARYPGSPEVPAALYWRARMAEQDHDLGKARAYYQKLTDRFSSYYYAGLARQRMQQIGTSGDPAPDPLLEKIPPATLPPSLGAEEEEAPDDVRIEKALLLQNGGFVTFAVRELQAAAAPQGPATWATNKIVDLYQDAGQYNLAIEMVKHIAPDYFSYDLSAMPRSYWQALFPRPYWTELKKEALQNRLDPFLVAALIRQESEFNAGAVSHANAWGLMQLLPNVGRTLARQQHVRRFSTSLLLVPNMNLRLGTRYFRELLDKYNGNVEYALAAYNAGSDRVQDWVSNGNFKDSPEFVESIPFTETREYVQAIVRNAVVYRQLYGMP
ncbi:MAG TPA: transglycosylase SLT domain-containing protein [Terriglobales bacterium]|nr:transglycosylase SLT domain-containing protein [Terriglobales bacterium]